VGILIVLPRISQPGKPRQRHQPTGGFLLVAALVCCLVLPASASTNAPVFAFPTPNRHLLNPSQGELFYMETVGKPWTHGQFGCSRTGGWQMHEGIDIRHTERDAKGEATDPVTATTDGRIAYINKNRGLSNYGIYVVIQHEIQGIPIWSLYAHLKEVREDLAVGQAVIQGETIATLGRTSNTRQGISKERAHLHFEIGFLTSLRYPQWLEKNIKGARNDHGLFNGQNFLGMDPSILLLTSHRFPSSFNLARYLTIQRPLFRVAIRATPSDWLQRYPFTLQNPHNLDAASIAGYEIHFDYTGVPVRIYPKTEAELPSKSRYTLLDVDKTEYELYPCRRLVTKNGGQFKLGTNGIRLLNLLTF
jgi:murein DD-endopeptidase MepM/ murein hydrolase activator NlpD